MPERLTGFFASFLAADATRALPIGFDFLAEVFFVGLDTVFAAILEVLICLPVLAFGMAVLRIEEELRVFEATVRFPALEERSTAVV